MRTLLLAEPIERLRSRAADGQAAERETMMLTERAELLIKPGEEENFEKAMRAEGLPLILSFEGVLSARLGRGVENPDKFMLLVEWRDMAAHDAYRGTPGQAALGKVISPHTRGGAMEHFEIA